MKAKIFGRFTILKKDFGEGKVSQLYSFIEQDCGYASPWGFETYNKISYIEPRDIEVKNMNNYIESIKTIIDILKEEDILIKGSVLIVGDNENEIFQLSYDETMVLRIEGVPVFVTY